MLAAGGGMGGRVGGEEDRPEWGLAGGRASSTRGAREREEAEDVARSAGGARDGGAAYAGMLPAKGRSSGLILAREPASLRNSSGW